MTEPLIDGASAEADRAVVNGANELSPPLRASVPSAEEIERLRAALEPFAAMGRVMETRARVTFGKMPKDSEIVCESSGEAGMGILTMGHFRDAAAILPDAAGWGGMYKPLSREPLGSACLNCAGCGWVCENHLDTPWPGLTDAECCSGAGSPCPVCEPEAANAPLIYSIAQEARRYAAFYEPNSDGRHTFTMFAEFVETRAIAQAIEARSDGRRSHANKER